MYMVSPHLSILVVLATCDTVGSMEKNSVLHIEYDA